MLLVSSAHAESRWQQPCTVNSSEVLVHEDACVHASINIPAHVLLYYLSQKPAGFAAPVLSFLCICARGW
jgi:hypothetical protein